MSRINKDNWEKFLDHNIHFESRLIHVGAPYAYTEEDHAVNFHTASDLIKSIMILEGSSLEPITINLMTYGGCFNSAMAIFDVIKSCRCEVTIKAMGAVMSAGGIILQAASEGCRLVYPNTTIMLHDGEDGYHGHPRNMERWADHGKKQRNEIYHMFAERCGGKADFYRKRFDKDWILTAEEAVSHNIADEVIDSNF